MLNFYIYSSNFQEAIIEMGAAMNTMILTWIFWIIGDAISTIFGAYIVKKYRNNYGLPTLIVLYSIYSVGANILASRITIYNIVIPFVVSGGTLIFPFVSQLDDMINEVYGRKRAYATIAVALIANILMATFILADAVLPVPSWEENANKYWLQFMVAAPRIMLASYLAFIVDELWNATIFAKLKSRAYKDEEAWKSNRKIVYLVLTRVFTSDISTMIIDSVVFYPIAFLGTLPANVVLNMIWMGALMKVILAIFNGPWYILYRILIKDVKREF
ncbi:conserved hypothetical integral membrane protein [Caldisphaera lagunensis DSM 15908]|uniref:Queuosine precursor transporter n=1 Tax=Caldisphaera lagunensis (strain DSM 15908 / JCM 11604 / ANMR 0165 / IC-154) TaxID=1056495 RepID=L0AA51_CALLD|nr:queuosine precursor transporter [Caldisphaera lagunensis]AFZ69925.1 conserved hypothetical integral membrane protein [Caldisphaera lagunensis DSM 15908]